MTSVSCMPLYSLLFFQLSAQQQSVAEEDEYEWVDEVKMVPQEVMEEVVVDKVDEVFVTEHREVPTVIARYPFRGQGMSMGKGEVSFFPGSVKSIVLLKAHFNLPNYSFNFDF